MDNDPNAIQGLQIETFLEGNIPDFRNLIDWNVVFKWIHTIVHEYGKEISNLNLIFCDDLYLRQINVTYLNHDYDTDIITFPYSSPSSSMLNSDIFISIPRIKENATTFGVSWENELYRVIIHGILHLIGFSDDTKAAKQKMRFSEDEALKKLVFS